MCSQTPNAPTPPRKTTCFNRGVRDNSSTSLYPLPTKIDWAEFMTAQHQPSGGLALRADEDLAADACKEYAIQPLYARLAANGDSYRVHDFTLLINGHHYALLGPAVEARRAALEGIFAAMVSIKPGTVKPANGDVITIDKPYSIGAYPVTQALYEAVMEANPSHFKGDAQRPVEMVNWSQANDFCTQLTAQSHAAGLYRDMKFQLPSEAQWEYACRAGSVGDFGMLGKRADGGKVQPVGREGTVDEMAWYQANSGDTTKPVGTKAPNAWGLYDMHGNVFEWCSDVVQGSYRAYRGGAWRDDTEYCTAAARLWYVPSRTRYDLGFRLALVPTRQ